MDHLFLAALAVWSVLSIARAIGMYDPAARFQRWRKWDVFRLVPVGAFFSPTVPETEHHILVRDVLADGRATPWVESPWIRPRCWWHAAWNPQKHTYRAKTECARSLLSAAVHAGPAVAGQVAPALALSDAYLSILQYAAALERPTLHLFTQFAVIERDVLTGNMVRSVVSAVHDI